MATKLVSSLIFLTTHQFFVVFFLFYFVVGSWKVSTFFSSSEIVPEIKMH